MKFVFLGTGTSSGVPAIGCECDVCTSSDPRDARTRTSAALLFDDGAGVERVILIDAGPDLRQQALREKLRRCDAIFFTHNHVDHTFGLDEVRRFNVVMKSPIDVLADSHTMEHLTRVYKHIFDRMNNVNDSFVATLIPRRIEAGAPVEFFGIRVTPIPLLHGRLPVLGFRFDRVDGKYPPGSPFPLAYCTDVSGIPPEAWRLLGGLSTLVIDALRHRHHPTHFTVDQALRAIDQCEPQRAYLVHMAHDLPHEATEAELPPHVRLAFDGLRLEEGDRRET